MVEYSIKLMNFTNKYYLYNYNAIKAINKFLILTSVIENPA